MTVEKPTRVIVTGDREWECIELARRVVARLVARYDRVVIVHGNARGVDQSFRQAAEEACVEHEPHTAKWDVEGPGAGPRRNTQMVESGATFCLAVHRDLAASKGTKDCVRKAIAAGIPVWLIDREDGEPRRITELPRPK